MPLTKKGVLVLDRMKKHYGNEKGKKFFYSMLKTQPDKKHLFEKKQDG